MLSLSSRAVQWDYVHGCLHACLYLMTVSLHLHACSHLYPHVSVSYLHLFVHIYTPVHIHAWFPLSTRTFMFTLSVFINDCLYLHACIPRPVYIPSTLSVFTSPVLWPTRVCLYLVNACLYLHARSYLHAAE
jgi:hypothetical protein